MRIVFTGGGTAGHVNPNLALIDALKVEGHEIFYIGSKTGVERKMVTAYHIPYYAVHSGKLRRYFSWQNIVDPFYLLVGIVQSFWRIRKLKPDLVFSKGGFVALPVVIGAYLNHVRVIAHESDLTPGLANRLSLPFIDTLCVTFAGSKVHIKNVSKVTVTGTPIRDSLLMGSSEKGRAICGFNAEKPCLLVMGGSQGARAINTCVRSLLPELLTQFQIIHLCGQGYIDAAYEGMDGYRQFEYANEELGDFFAASVGVISRAGANALYEILACKKPHVLIPLSRQSTRGDQIQNAQYFEQQGISIVIQQDNLTPETLLKAIERMMKNRDGIVNKINMLDIRSATSQIVNLICSH